MGLMKGIEVKNIYKLEEVADILDVDMDTVKDIIDSGDLIAIGKSKGMVKKVDLYRFINGEIRLPEDGERPIDSIGNQRYPQHHSIEINDLTDKEWDLMKKRGIEELKPYWNEPRRKWCLALSLGYDENHKRVRKVITANTQEEVWSKYGEFKAENKVLPEEGAVAFTSSAIFEEKKHPKQDMLFKDYIIEYMSTIMRNKGSRAYDSKVNSSRHIIDGLGNYKLCEIDVNKLSEFLNAFVSKTYKRGGKTMPFSQSSINKVYNFLHEIIRYASDDEEILKKDFMRSIKKPDSQQYKDKEYKALIDDEFKMISNVVKDNPMISTWIHIMMYTGVRPSEALALKFSDINYEKETIKIRRTLIQKQNHDVVNQRRIGAPKPDFSYLKNERKKGNMDYQKRNLALSPKILEIIKFWENYVRGNKDLMEMKRANGTEELLFCGSKGQLRLYRDYAQEYKRVLCKAGLKISDFNPYRFRHSFCTRCLRKGLDIKTVQRMMGDNTSEMVLKVYANMDESDILRGSKIYTEDIDKILID